LLGVLSSWLAELSLYYWVIYFHHWSKRGRQRVQIS
jgi:hypothetical protein